MLHSQAYNYLNNVILQNEKVANDLNQQAFHSLEHQQIENTPYTESQFYIPEHAKDSSNNRNIFDLVVRTSTVFMNRILSKANYYCHLYY